MTWNLSIFANDTTHYTCLPLEYVNFCRRHYALFMSTRYDIWLSKTLKYIEKVFS